MAMRVCTMADNLSALQRCCIKVALSGISCQLWQMMGMRAGKLFLAKRGMTESLLTSWYACPPYKALRRLRCFYDLDSIVLSSVARRWFCCLYVSRAGLCMLWNSLLKTNSARHYRL